MREALRRLERLEAAAVPKGNAPSVVFLIGWGEGDPIRAGVDGWKLDREDGENAEDFTRRAGEYFQPASGCRLVWLDTGAPCAN